MAAAERCSESLTKYGVAHEFVPAVVPGDSLLEDAMKDKKFMQGFSGDQRWSRTNRCVAAHLSHRRVWGDIAQSNSPGLVLEHDAILMSEIPDVEWGMVTNVGKPSFGRFQTSKRSGIQPLFTKRYFPGAHGYIVSPDGARMLLKSGEGGPTDTFLSLQRFPWLQEYNPHFVDVVDTFSSIQKEAGTRAKHADKKGYRLL